MSSDNGNVPLAARTAYESPSWKDRLQNNGKLASALVKAQAKAEALVRGEKNPNFNRPYATSESLIGESKELLNGEFLALLPIAFESLPEEKLVECDAKTTFILRGVTIRRWFKLIHSSGEFELIGPYDWPTNPNKGAPTNLAFASTDTLSLAYVYRDVLGFPRLTPQEIKMLEAEEERQLLEANSRKEPVLPRASSGPQLSTTIPSDVKTRALSPEPTKPVINEAPKPVPKAIEAPKVTFAPALTTVSGVPSVAAAEDGKKIVDEMSAMLDAGAAKRTEQAVGVAPQATFSGPEVVAPVGSGAPTATPTTTVAPQAAATAPVTKATPPPPTDEKLKARQVSMLSRLQAYGAKTLKENGGDATTFGNDLNLAAGSEVMLEGRFKRAGLTDESMKRLEPVLAKAGV